MSRIGRWAGVPAIGYLALFFLFPLATILTVYFGRGEDAGIQAFAQILGTPYYIRTLLVSFGQAGLSTALTLLCAVPSAYVFVRYRFCGRDTLLALASVPFVLPTVVVALAFQALLGRAGLLNDLAQALFGLQRPPIQLEQSLLLILIAHVFYNYALALRMIVGYWSNQSPRVEEAARTLGANAWQVWWHVRLPLLRPILAASGLLVFIFTFTSFGVVLILGGIQFATIEVQIYYQTVAVFNLPMAGALCLVQIFVVGIGTIAYTRIQRNVGGAVVSQRSVAQPARTPREKGLVSVTVLFMAILLFLPLAALVWMSLTVAVDGISLANFGSLLMSDSRSVLPYPPLLAIVNSLVIALLTTILSVSIGLLATMTIMQTNVLGRLVDILFVLPLGVSAVTLGFGTLLAFDTPPVAWRTEWWMLPILHSLVALPLVTRSVLPTLRGMPPTLPEAASLLGASQWQRLRFVWLPLVAQALAVGAVFAFTVSMGEFGATAFVARPETPTMPTAIFRLLSQPRPQYVGQALAMSVLLMLMCFGAFRLLERLRGSITGEF